MLGFNKQKKKIEGYAIYFTEKELENQRIKNILLSLIETKINTSFIGKNYIIVGKAEYEILKRSGSSVTDYKKYKKRGIKKLQVDGAKEIGKYRGKRLLLKKEND